MRPADELEGDLRSLRAILEDVRSETEAVASHRSSLYALAAHLHLLYSCMEDAAYRALRAALFVEADVASFAAAGGETT